MQKSRSKKPRKISFWQNFLLGKLLKLSFFILVIFNLVLASWYQLHGDLYFHSDIARDFLLFNEIANKKIMLIGARSGAAGVYHGPFWYYLNFPVFFISGGNPIAVGWFWIFLIVVFLISGFQLAKKLFDEVAAYFFVLLMSTYFIFQSNSFSHPVGSLMMTLFFFYTFWQYLKTFKVQYLAINVIIVGLLIQLEIVNGVPFFFLSLVFATVEQIRRKKLIHWLAFFLILIPLSSYIVFDIRHDFFQFKSLMTFVSSATGQSEGFLPVLINRLDNTSNIGASLTQISLINRILLVLFLLIAMKSIRDGVNSKIYIVFLRF